MNIDIAALTSDHLDEAAQLFCREYANLRSEVLALSDVMSYPTAARKRIAELLTHSADVVALSKGQVVGYLCWHIVEQFRGADRRSA